MSVIKLPFSRRYPPSLNKEGLRRETNILLKKKGYDNHYNAITMHNSIVALLSSNSPLLKMFEKIPKRRFGKEWLIAYELVIKYLIENNLTLTDSIVNKEYPKLANDTKNSYVNDTAANYISKLCKQSQNVSFEKRVRTIHTHKLILKDIIEGDSQYIESYENGQNSYMEEEEYVEYYNNEEC